MLENLTFVLIGGDRFETLAANEQIPGCSLRQIGNPMLPYFSFFFEADRLIVMLSLELKCSQMAVSFMHCFDIPLQCHILQAEWLFLHSFLFIVPLAAR